MGLIGFSTGSVAHGDVRQALSILRTAGTSAVELSALRASELGPLLSVLPNLDLSGYPHVAVHAPSAFPASDEPEIARALLSVAERGIPVVLHPDVIRDFSLWRTFGRSLLIENMDPRKPGRDVAELTRIFDRLPDASLCLDLAHARRCDTSMIEAYRLLTSFTERLAQLHVSELDAECRHRPLTPGAIRAYREIAGLIPEDVPVIIESPVGSREIPRELAAAREIWTGGLLHAA